MTDEERGQGEVEGGPGRLKIEFDDVPESPPPPRAGDAIVTGPSTREATEPEAPTEVLGTPGTVEMPRVTRPERVPVSAEAFPAPNPDQVASPAIADGPDEGQGSAREIYRSGVIGVLAKMLIAFGALSVAFGLLGQIPDFWESWIIDSPYSAASELGSLGIGIGVGLALTLAFVGFIGWFARSFRLDTWLAIAAGWVAALGSSLWLGGEVGDTSSLGRQSFGENLWWFWPIVTGPLLLLIGSAALMVVALTQANRTAGSRKDQVELTERVGLATMALGLVGLLIGLGPAALDGDTAITFAEYFEGNLVGVVGCLLAVVALGLTCFSLFFRSVQVAVSAVWFTAWTLPFLSLMWAMLPVIVWSQLEQGGVVDEAALYPAVIGLILVALGSLIGFRAIWTRQRPDPVAPVRPAVVQQVAMVPAWAAQSQSAPAGWHPDPYDPTRQRYWDGQQWTDHTA